MATLYAKSGGGNWTAAGTWSNVSSAGGDSSGPPTAADDAIIDAGSGNITIDSGAVCRSADFTGYTGTLTHNAVNLTIGDATSGLGNIGLKMVAGMTYTLVNAATSAIVFASTSGTAQTVDFAGKTSGNVNFSTAGSWQLTGTHVQDSTATVTHTRGTLDTNGQTCTWGQFSSDNSNSRTLTLGASSITITGGTSGSWDCANNANQSVNAGTSIITLSGANQVFTNGTTSGNTYYEVKFTGGGSGELRGDSGVNSYTNIRYTGTAAKTNVLIIRNNIKITGVFEVAGNSSINRVLVRSQTAGTSRTITNTGATMTWSNVDFMDIALSNSYNASAITGLSGDCGGNSSITFTTAQTQYWVGGTGNWSAAGEWGTSSGGSGGRVPLPQDDVVFDSNSFSAGSQTATCDMPRAGKSVTWTGATNSPTWAVSTATTIFGSLTLISGMTFNHSANFTFGGRGAFTVTSAGKSWCTSSNPAVSFTSPGATYTLQDAFTKSQGNGLFSINNGTLNTAGFTVTINGTGSFNNTNIGNSTRALNLTNTTLVLAQASGTVLSFSTSSFTLTSTGSTISVTNTGASSKTFNGGGATFNTLAISGGGAGSIDIVGSNTFGNLPQVSGGTKTLRFTAGTTTTFTGGTDFGNSTNVVTISSITAATHTLTKSSGVISADYLHLTNSIATGGASWYAGDNSTDNGGNTGWIFSAPGASAGNFFAVF